MYPNTTDLVRRALSPALVLLATIAMLPGCTDDPLQPGNVPQITLRDLPPLGGNSYYELWLGEPETRTDSKQPRPDHSEVDYYSIGRFQITAEGKAVGIGGGATDFRIPDGRNPNLVVEGLLTIETGSSQTPTLRLLGGTFTGTASRAVDTLRIVDEHGFTAGVLPDAGGFILDAPTATDTAASTRGIWFVNITRDNLGMAVDTLPGLSMPTLGTTDETDGWTYKTWLVKMRSGSPAEYIPLGGFVNPRTVDSDGAGPFAGPQPSPYMAPGADFVNGTERNLTDSTYSVIVSLDPILPSLSVPFLPILIRDRIVPGTPPRQTLAITATDKNPNVIVVLDR